MVQPSKQYNRDIRKGKPQGISTQGNNATGMLLCMNHEVNLLGATADDNFGLKKLSIVYLRKKYISKCFTTRTIQPRHCSVPNDFDSLGAWEVPSCRSKSPRSSMRRTDQNISRLTLSSSALKMCGEFHI